MNASRIVESRNHKYLCKKASEITCGGSAMQPKDNTIQLDVFY